MSFGLRSSVREAIEDLSKRIDGRPCQGFIGFGSEAPAAMAFEYKREGPGLLIGVVVELDEEELDLVFGDLGETHPEANAYTIRAGQWTFYIAPTKVCRLIEVILGEI